MVCERCLYIVHLYEKFITRNFYTWKFLNLKISQTTGDRDSLQNRSVGFKMAQGLKWVIPSPTFIVFRFFNTIRKYIRNSPPHTIILHTSCTMYGPIHNPAHSEAGRPTSNSFKTGLPNSWLLKDDQLWKLAKGRPDSGWLKDTGWFQNCLIVCGLATTRPTDIFHVQ